MPIIKGSKAAHDRAVKAAETRRRNKSNRTIDEYVSEYPGLAEEMRYERAAPITRKLRSVGPPRKKKAPPFPKSYHATPTHKVTRDLKLKQTPKPQRKRHTVTAPRSAKQIRAMSNAELERQYRYWWLGTNRDRSIPVPKRMSGELPYTIRAEYNRRVAATHGELPRIKAHQARRGVRKQRGGK